MRFDFFKRGVRFTRTSRWLPTALVLLVVLLAGGRLISLSIEQRAQQMRRTAADLVTQYARAIDKQLETQADAARESGTRQELDRLLSGLRLGQMIDPQYDFQLSKIESTGDPSRAFVSSRLDPPDDGVSGVVAVPPGFEEQLPSGYMQLTIRPKTGWYPARELAAAIGLLAVVAWLLAFATHDLVHSLHRAREALSLSRRQLQLSNRKLVAEIEQRENLLKKFQHSRYHDAFTGLPNRRYFMDHLDRALREVRTRQRKQLAVMLIGIDRFKRINETLGRTAGDELMVRVARRFEKVLESVDCVLARWSSEQFAVLMYDVESVDAAVDTLQQTLLEAIELRKHRLSVAARIGLTRIESGVQRTEEVIREADIALSVARRRERASTVAYTPAMGGSAASLVSLEADLHVALERRELRLLFQPIVDLSDDHAAGAEALLRWQHPVEGVLTPDRFLGVAEEADLIVPITRWTILRACRVISQWRRRLPADRDFYVSVNLSAAALRDPELGAYVSLALKETGIAPHMLKFELTEGGLISNPGAMREVLDGLHHLGIEIMLDDFGTGYSSLRYLELFPFDYLKIDRPFLNRAGSDQANTAIAAAIVQMAASLGLKSVAEIVETEAAARDLKRMGCNYAQGYFYCEPIEAEAALEVLRTRDIKSPLDRSGSSSGYTDDSPTVTIPQESLLISEDTMTLSADTVAEELRRKARRESG